MKSNDDLTLRIRELDARRQIHDAMLRYARGVDRCDPDLIRAAFHPDGWDDHGAFSGSVEDFIDWVLKLHLEGYTWTTHSLSNSYIELSDNIAKAETYVTATLRFEQDGQVFDLIGEGRYLDHFEQRDGDWKLVKRRAVVDSNRIEPVTDYSDYAAGIDGGGDTLVAELTHGTRGKDDPSYAHFGSTAP